MVVQEKALIMLEKHPLCDFCLGRQFAFIARGIENNEKGKAIKSVLFLEAQALAKSNRTEGKRIMKILALHGFFKPAYEAFERMEGKIEKENAVQKCFLCENCFEKIDYLAQKAVEKLKDYEFSSFLVGIELPHEIEEREDDFRARFKVEYGENIKVELGRLLSRKIALHTGKPVEYAKPDIVLLVNPIEEEVKLQINPLYIAGRYRKLVRGIPQSKWFCTKCNGKGCEKCNWTGKMYSESVEEIISKPFLEASLGLKTAFHASGREDVDALMLGKGRPFVIEISQPKRRALNLKQLEKAVNAQAEGKVEVSDLSIVNGDFVRRLKRAESAQKEYRVTVEFENEVSDEDLKALEEKLSKVVVKQKTPTRVLHRRADLTREKYIYEVKLRRLSPNKAVMRIRCQGGLYVKELVTGDDGRTTPSVAEILNRKAKPIELDVLNVEMKD